MVKRLELKNISKSYFLNDTVLDVIDDISFDLEDGKIIAIVGPSGTGKSTILNLIAGIIKPTSGEVNKNGIIGYMFQHDLLFEWRNIFSNLFVGLEINKKITKI